MSEWRLVDMLVLMARKRPARYLAGRFVWRADQATVMTCTPEELPMKVVDPLGYTTM